MPRQVDHTERRRQIAEAVWRLAARSGLEDVSLRQVAAEAGLPPRLLQYYFGTRDDLLLGALEILNADAQQHALGRISALGSSPPLHSVLRCVLLELLPLDPERHALHLVYAAYFIRMLSEPGLRAAAAGAEPAVEVLVGELIMQAQQQGLADAALDANDEADLLVAAALGLQAQVLLEQQSSERAVELIDRQLQRIFRVDSTPS